MAVTTSPPEPAWPKQSWFLRGPLLSSIAMIAAAAALATELSIMLIAREVSLGYLGIALSALGIAVIFRSRWVALASTTAGSVISALFATEYVGIWTVSVFAMFLFARQGGRVVPAAAVSTATIYGVLVTRTGEVDSPDALVAATFCVAAAAAGSVVRLQAESWNAARRRAHELAAAQVVELQQAVKDERLRIARDLHDVVGHELAVVNINVGVAEVSLPTGATAAENALHAAREGLQRTLQETQKILDLLRDEGSEPGERSELALVEHLPSLVARIADAGGRIDSHIDAALPELDVDVSAAAYRIVQEALTNAGKYGSGPARVSVRSSAARVIIDVENERSSVGRTGPRVGYGLVGMRERAETAGGSIRITDVGDTFRVHVELPTKASASSSAS